jgi:hypothetical protein
MLLGVEKGWLFLNWGDPDLIDVNADFLCIMASFVPHNLRQFALRLIILNALGVYLLDLWRVVCWHRWIWIRTLHWSLWYLDLVAHHLLEDFLWRRHGSSPRGHELMHLLWIWSGGHLLKVTVCLMNTKKLWVVELNDWAPPLWLLLQIWEKNFILWNLVKGLIVADFLLCLSEFFSIHLVREPMFLWVINIGVSLFFSRGDLLHSLFNYALLSSCLSSLSMHCLEFTRIQSPLID